MNDTDFIARRMKIEQATRTIADPGSRAAERRRRLAELEAQYDEERRAERARLSAEYGVDVEAIDAPTASAILAEAEAELNRALDADDWL